MTIEFQYVPVPTQAPQCCIICKSQKGPIADTFVETPLGHLYVCELCVSRLARAAGLIEGDRHNQLIEASQSLAQAEREIANRETQIEGMNNKIKARNARIVELEAKLEVEHNETLRLQHIAGEMQRNALQLAEGITVAS